MDSFIVSLKVLSLVQQIPFTQIALLLLAGCTVSLAYNLKKELNSLSERLNTLDVDIKCAHAIARMCDDDIAASNIPGIRSDMDLLHSNMTRSIGLLELLNKLTGINQKEIHRLTQAHTHDATVYQQWHGVLKGETQYGQLELTITVTNMEFNTRSQNDFWLKNISNSDGYIDEVINDIIVTMSKVPFTQKEFSVSRDSVGFSGLVRTRIEWNDVGRYYEVPEYFKKFLIQWEKRLVPV